MTMSQQPISDLLKQPIWQMQQFATTAVIKNNTHTFGKFAYTSRVKL